MDTHHLKISTTPLVALCLFNGSLNSTISKIANLPIIFSTDDCMNLDFYVTPLNSSCSLVLGYNWLTQHNPLINWVNMLINFRPSLWENLTVKIADDGLDFIFSLFILFYFSFSFSFFLSIFRTTWVRGYQSRCHISHNLMA